MSFLRNNTVLLFFLTILLLVIIALLSFKPRGEVFVDTDNIDVAKIEVKDFRMYQIKKDITDTIIQGKQAIQYKEYEIFKDILLSRSLEKQLFENIRAKHVRRKHDLYSFFNGIDYQRSDGLHFISESGVLNLATEIFRGNGKFTLYHSQGFAKGINIVYNKKKETINAQNIVSKIELD